MASVIIVSEAIFGDICPPSSSFAGRYVADGEYDLDCREVRKLRGVSGAVVFWSDTELSGRNLKRRYTSDKVISGRH